MTAGAVRYDEDWLRDYRARNGRWTKGTIQTDVAGPACRATVPTCQSIDGQMAPESTGTSSGTPLSASAARRGAALVAGAPIPYERDVMAACIKMLALHPRVAWAHRMNVGGFTNPNGQKVRIGFAGCSDIIGQLVTGEFLAVECKRPGGHATPAQGSFLQRVRRAGGVAFVASSVDDVQRELAA